MTYYYHSVVDSPHLPRDLDGDSAQTAIVTLIGEFWPHDAFVDVPSAAIVEILQAIDFTEASVRAGLSRLARRGTLDATKVGRKTSYRPSADLRESIPASELLTMSFGASNREWDGEWRVVVFSLPEAERQRRDTLREWLRWLGFGPVRDGVWISPHASLDMVVRSLDRLLPTDGLVFKSSHIAGDIEPEAIWPLAELRGVYRDFLTEFRPAVYALRAGEMSGPEALRLSLRLVGRWRAFPTVDPDLPLEALPPDWPRAESRRLFADLYDGALPVAARWLRAIVAKHDAQVAAAVRVLSLNESMAEFSRAAPRPLTVVDPETIGPLRTRVDAC